MLDWEKIAKAVLHPLRVRLLDEAYSYHLVDGKFSPNEMAVKLGEPLGNVSYHVRQLYEQGLLRKAGTTQVRGAVAHYYKLADKALTATPPRRTTAAPRKRATKAAPR